MWENLAQHCKPEYIKNYINKGYDVNYKGRGGMTLLMFAAGESYESVKILIENGADDGRRGQVYTYDKHEV